jgi:hypothetical protein
MKGSPDTPTIHLGVRRPNVALSEKVEHLLQYGGWMHSAPSMLQLAYHFDKMGMEHLPEYLAISSATWVAHLPPTRQSMTGKSRPNRNVFVGVYSLA